MTTVEERTAFAKLEALKEIRYREISYLKIIEITLEILPHSFLINLFTILSICLIQGKNYIFREDSYETAS